MYDFDQMSLSAATRIHRRLILKKSEISLCRNNYLLSSGDEVIITVETRQFNLTGDQHGHASVSSTSISINEAVIEGITMQRKSPTKQRC